MDNNNNKAWIWRKKSTEKNIVAIDKPFKGNEDEVCIFLLIFLISFSLILKLVQLKLFIFCYELHLIIIFIACVF